MTSSHSSSQPWRQAFDGADILSPKAEIEAEIAELEQMPPSPERNLRLETLQDYLKEATEEGGFQRKG